MKSIFQLKFATQANSFSLSLIRPLTGLSQTVVVEIPAHIAIHTAQILNSFFPILYFPYQIQPPSIFSENSAHPEQSFELVVQGIHEDFACLSMSHFHCIYFSFPITLILQHWQLMNCPLIVFVHLQNNDCFFLSLSLYRSPGLGSTQTRDGLKTLRAACLLPNLVWSPSEMKTVERLGSWSSVSGKITGVISVSLSTSHLGS